jgi:hypothetical protein
VTEDAGSAAVETAVGDQVAGYRIEAEIGHGGMASVFRALDVKLGRTVALKILAPRLADDESFRRRFIHESRAAAAVDHPHIVPVFEAGEADGILFIAMRYVSTGDVRSLLEREGSLPVRQAVDITMQVASAIDAAHARGLVHRDIKPANMLLAESGEGRADHVYLSDFGLSKHSLAPTGLTSTGQFMGTLDYVAPEQIEGKAVDGRADQYALACATVEMLTGAPPFRRDENLALMWAQLSEAPPVLRERRPELPPAIDEVMARALAKAPGQRYPTCMEFAEALLAASTSRPGPAGDPGQPGTHEPTALASVRKLAVAPDPASSAPEGSFPASGAGGPGFGAAAAGRAAAPSPSGTFGPPGQELPAAQAGPLDQGQGWGPGQGGPPGPFGQGSAMDPAGTLDSGGPYGGPASQSNVPTQGGFAGPGRAPGASGLPSAGGMPGRSGPPPGQSAPPPGRSGLPSGPGGLPPAKGGSQGPGAPPGVLGFAGSPAPAAPAPWPSQAPPSDPATQGIIPGSGLAGAPWSSRSSSPTPWQASAASGSVPQQSGPPPWSYPPAPADPQSGPGLGSDRYGSPDPYRSARIPAPTSPRQRSHGRGKVVLGVLAAIVLVGCLAVLGVKLLGKHHAGSSHGGGSGATTSTGHKSSPVGKGSTPPPVSAPREPSRVVVAYFRAINHHRYRLAWRLGGKAIHGGYQKFRDGFTGTEHDTVQILAASGDNVTARITATQTDGSTKVYQGIYTVVRGAIIQSSVQRVG